MATRTKNKLGGINPRELHNIINANENFTAACTDIDYNGVDSFTITFDQGLSVAEDTELDTIISEYVKDASIVYPKIYDYLDSTVKGSHDIHDIDYTIQCKPNLYPKRTFSKGELQKVDWYGDDALTELVLDVTISYVRDVYGFAQERTTTRNWKMSDGSNYPDSKITSKKYTINMIDQITEGKKRRTNIVDGIQLPVMGLMIEVLTVAPYSLSTGQILLMGREFLDRHETEFNKFKENSSSITDTNDPNFGKKSIVVALELAAAGGDDWLNATPATLGGASILQYLSNEFTI